MSKFMRFFFAMVAGLVFCPSIANAVGSSGFELATNSARSLAKANAVAADSDEPSALVSNPAILSKIKGNQISSSVSLVTLSTKYDGNNGGVSEEGSTPLATVPATFISLSTPVEKIKVGVGVNSPFGLQTQYDSVTNFRYTGYFNEIKTIGYNAGASYEIAPWISIGGGYTYLDTDLKQVAKLNSNFITSSVIPGTTGLADAPFELDVEGSGHGWMLGAFLTPHEKHSFGFFYRSQIQAELRGTLDVDDLQGAVMQGVFGGANFHTSADTDITFPDTFTLAYNFKPNDTWELEFDFGWTNWSTFDRVDLAFGATNIVLNGLEPVHQDFNDTFSFQFGSTYTVSKNLDIMFGYLFYERAANELNYNNAIPDGDRHGVSTGFTYKKWSYEFDLSYMCIFINASNIDSNSGVTANAVVDGDYSSISHLISASITKKF